VTGTIIYGGSGNTRTFGYDIRNRLTSDEMKTSAGATVAKILYGWDDNSNLTSKTTTGFAGAASNAYKYDKANRLTEWNNGVAATVYEYDKAGNRVKAGGKTFTYNERNQLGSESVSGTTYQYTARGTLARSTTGTVSLDTQSDAFGQVIRQYHTPGAYSDYSYDGLGRAVKAGFQYTGLENDLAADGTATYVRDPVGGLVGVQAAGNQRLVWTDIHQDVVGQFGATSSALAGSAAYDPLGKLLASGGMSGNLGYQSEWTDQQTGRVNMHARWYNPETGQFDSRDAMSLPATPESANANRYAYANQNPLTGTDPSGHARTADVVGFSQWYSDEVVADYKDWWENGFPQNRTGDPAIDCGNSDVTCFFEGLFSILDIGELFNALGSLMKGISLLFEGWDKAYEFVEEGFKALQKEADAWRDKISKAHKMSSWLAGILGWGCVLSGACAPLNDCFGDGKGRCTYHVGALTGQAILSALTYGAAKIYERLTSLINKSLGRDRHDDDDGHNDNGDGSSNPHRDPGDSRFDQYENDQDRLNAPQTPTDDGPGPGPGRQNNDGNDPADDDPDGIPGVTVCSTSHSFDPATPVLMADGSTKPIGEIEVGQEVLATDPVTGQTSPQEVTLLHLNLDEKLTDITLGEGEGDRSTRGPTSTLHTTQNHPFWDATTKSWVEAKDLVPGGSTLIGPDGQPQTVLQVRNYTGRTEMRDLTVANIHTYHVLAGEAPVLVHNNDSGPISLGGGGAGEACGFVDEIGARQRLAAIVDEIAESTAKDKRPGTISETVGELPSGLLVAVHTRALDIGRYPVPHRLLSALNACGHRHGGCSEVAGAARVMNLGARPISVTTMGIHSHKIGRELHKAILAPCGRGCTDLLSALGMTSAGRLD
jgi:RHS repeat-associated protein